MPFKKKDFINSGEGKERKRGRETLTGCMLHMLWLRTKPATEACALTGLNEQPFIF